MKFKMYLKYIKTSNKDIKGFIDWAKFQIKFPLTGDLDIIVVSVNTEV